MCVCVWGVTHKTGTAGAGAAAAPVACTHLAYQYDRILCIIMCVCVSVCVQGDALSRVLTHWLTFTLGVVCLLWGSGTPLEQH